MSAGHDELLCACFCELLGCSCASVPWSPACFTHEGTTEPIFVHQHVIVESTVNAFVCLRAPYPCVVFSILAFQLLSRLPHGRPAGMGKSLLTLMLPLGVVLHSACAESLGSFEPYQVLDIRMEEGVNNHRDSEYATGKVYRNAFLSNDEERGLHKINAVLLAQKRESDSLSKTMERFKGS